MAGLCGNAFLRRIHCLFLVVLVLFCAMPPVKAEGVSAQSYLLMDAKTGAVLEEKSADARLPMASTTKIMTALVVIERLKPTEMVTVSPEAVGTEGSTVYLYAGERLSVRDLLFALMLESANDAAVALAIHAAGSTERFVAWMNEKALQLELSNTQFQNPHGLSEEAHYSSARDLALIMREALSQEFFRALIAAQTYSVPVSETGAAHYFHNHNRLLRAYGACIGGKTGYTKRAGRCLVTAAERDGAALIAVTLNAPDDWRDHTLLFERGFALYRVRILAEKGELLREIPVVGAVEKSVFVSNTETLACALRDKDETHLYYELPHFVFAPVTGVDALERNAPLPSLPLPAGRAVFTVNGTPVAAVNLYYVNSVQPYVPPTFWERMLQFFGWKN